MKAKDLLKSILLIGAVFWAFIVVAYFIGEKNERESVEAKTITKTDSVEAKTITKTDTLYIQKERICERDCYTGAVECQEFVQPVRGAAQ